MIQPMLASLMDAPLDDPALIYEPKYDGIRAIAEIDAKRGVTLRSRLGNEKTHQFPEITSALQKWARKLKEPVVLDGEIVALDGKGEPSGFQQLQGRIHVASAAPSDNVAFIAFDVLVRGRSDLRDLQLVERRAILERLFGRTGSPLLRISAMERGDGRALYKEALDHGWEGLIAKRADSQYKSGKRTPDWRKLKIVHEQEFVIGGWTEPRQTRTCFGALLLGVYDENGNLIYVGHTGTGFNEKELARVMKLLKPRETKECPFRGRPKTNERAHWVRPELVAQIKFTEWTADGRLRHPVYLGLRDDKKPTEVRREEHLRVRSSGFRVRGSGVRGSNSEPGTKNQEPRTKNREPGTRNPEPGLDHLIDELNAIEGSRRDGVLMLPDGDRFTVTNLHKVFWPARKLTKGDLFRYYVRVAPFILPAVADRQLVMKRYPNGVTGKWFYQHRVEDVPAGVRTEVVSVAERRPQIIGGTLKTLLYTAQLAAISQDPWFSRVQHAQFADYVALPAGTPYDAGLLFCQIVATVVAQKHPKVATVERSVRARGKRVYVDFMQNVLGKTLAAAYSARASDYAGVSTPLSWREIDEGLEREDFTIESVPGRLTKVGDLWGELRKSKGIDLARVTRYAERTGSGRLKGETS